jgi:diguanylate cyclase (GGDEF)-like protein/PAS domain S-box-containing protein
MSHGNQEGDQPVSGPADAELARLLPVGVFATDPTGSVTYLSERGSDLSGLAGDLALGRPWFELVHPDDRPAAERAWARLVDGEEDFTTEVRFVAPDGTARPVRASARARRDAAGILQSCIGTITEPVDRRARVAVIAGLVERHIDMVVVLDEAGIIRWANQATERVLGHDRGAKVGTPVLELVHPDDADRAAAGLVNAVTIEGPLAPMSLRVRSADGSWRDVEGTTTNMLDEPTVQGIVITARDITERRELERRVHELEDRFAAALRHSPVGRALVGLDGRWLQVNDACATLLGRDAEQLVGSLGVDAVHPDDRDRVRGEIQRLVRREVEALTIDVRFLRPGADRVWARFTIWFVFDDDGEPLYFATDITDVTELRVARDAQEQTQRYFEALVQQSSDIVTVLERDGTRRSSSSAGERVLGWGPGSVPGNDIFSLVHPDDVDRAVEAFQLALADPDHGVEPLVLRVRHADGTYRYLETVARDLTHDEAVQGVVLNSRDVTERVAAEDELRATDARFRALLEHSADAIVLTDRAGEIVYISPGSERIFGRRNTDVEGTDGLFAIHPDDLERTAATFVQVMEEPGKRVEMTLRVRHLDGSYRDVEAVGQNRMDDPSVGGVVWNIREVTERLRTEAELHETQARFAALVSESDDVITVNNLDGTLTFASPSVARVLGYEPEDLIGTEGRRLIHPDDVQPLEEAAFDQFARGTTEPIQYRTQHRDGTWRVLEAIITDLTEEPSVQGVVTNARDITARRSAEQRAGELVEVLEATNELVITSDPAGSIVYANRSARALLGAHEHQHVSALSSERSRERLRTEIMPLVRQRGSWSGELELIDPTGQDIPVAATVQTHRDERGAIVRIATVAHDITDLKAAQKRLEFEATHDPLTGLPNRALFREIGERALALASRTHDPLAVLFLDLDGFKLVNDSFGHDVGDALLDLVAQRLREAVRAGDVLARLGGDEFVILCERPRTEHQMFDLAARIIETVSEPFSIGEHDARVGLSVGIAFSRDASLSITELIRDADVAMYQAKHAGRGCARLFEASLTPSDAVTGNHRDR